MTREGTRVVTYAFEDAVTSRRPASWTVSGAGGEADVHRVDTSLSNVAEAEVAIPQSVDEQFVFPASGVVSIPCRLLERGGITIPVVINGKTLQFELDTGTTRILMDVGAATRVGLRVKVGHTVARDATVGGVAAPALSIQAVDLGAFGFDRLLGNEFFTGHVVHVDYLHRRLDILSHAAFVPPLVANEVPLNAAEGLPIVDGHVRGTAAERVAIDGGGPTFLSADFLSRAGMAVSVDGNASTSYYIEGPVRVVHGDLGSLSIGLYAFKNIAADFEIPNGENLDIPLDAIVRTSILTYFEWWFDYDDGELWFRQ